MRHIHITGEDFGAISIQKECGTEMYIARITHIFIFLFTYIVFFKYFRKAQCTSNLIQRLKVPIRNNNPVVNIHTVSPIIMFIDGVYCIWDRLQDIERQLGSPRRAARLLPPRRQIFESM